MSNDTSLSIKAVFTADGKVNKQAMLDAASSEIDSFADNHENRVLRVRDVVTEKVWQAGVKDGNGHTLDLRHLPQATLAKMAAQYLQILPSDENLKDLSGVIRQAMTADERFAFIARGPRAGYHMVSKYNDEEREVILKQSRDSETKTVSA